MDNRVWKVIKRHLKYSDDELEKFQARSENRDIMEKAEILNNMDIVARVVSSHGCNSGHREGQEIILDGAGNLRAGNVLDKTCIFLLGNLPSFVYGIHELVYAGIPPKKIKLRINRAGCADVGVENCGWGRVILELSVRERKVSSVA